MVGPGYVIRYRRSFDIYLVIVVEYWVVLTATHFFEEGVLVPTQQKALLLWVAE